MGNMSYCKFRNTESDMDDCISHLRDEKSMSKEEKRAAQRMLNSILDFLDDSEIADFDYGKAIQNVEVYIEEIEES